MRLKSQIELSMLTRFAMVFFIMSLAMIMLVFSGSEQRGLCKTQAQLAAKQIASSINQVLTSPAEDERKVIPLTAVLSVGERDRSRYSVNITKRPESKVLTVSVVAESKDCSAFQSVGYGEVDDANVVFSSKLNEEAHAGVEVFAGRSYDLLKLTPSKPDDRTSYLIVLRCMEKQGLKKKFLYLQNCNFVPPDTSVNPESCLKLKSDDPGVPDVDDNCGFG